MRALYVDLDSTLLDPAARCCATPTRSSRCRASARCRPASAPAPRSCSCPAAARATVSENARLFAQPAYIFEAGSCLVLDGEEIWLTGDYMPDGEAGTIHEQIEAAGAPALLLEHYAGRLEYHDPWHHGREVSHLFRGLVDAAEVDALLAERGHGALRLVDNGGVHRRSPDLVALDEVRAYHLVPRGASKANAVARHMRARGFTAAGRHRGRRLARGHGDGGPRRHVLVRRQRRRSATPRCWTAVGHRANVRVAEDSYGAGVYEAVVTTLAGG